MRPLVPIALTIAATACASARTSTRHAEVLDHVAEPPMRDDVAVAEASLASGATLDAVVRVALARNPDLAELRARARSAVAAGRASSGRPALELMYQQWAVPLSEPYALNRADTLMLGVRQAIPAPGSLDARARAGVEEAAMRAEAVRVRTLDVELKVRHAFFELYASDREYEVHLEHVAIAEQMVELARGRYRAGSGSQEDVLRTRVDLTRLHNELLRLQERSQSARALLNALMARAPDAPIGPVAEPAPRLAKVDATQLEGALEARRPEVAAAGLAVRRSEAALGEARSSRWWPDFTVGVDYWFMPQNEMQHAYGATLSMTLPWLNPRYADEERRAEEALSADRAALESVRNAARYELRAAAARWDAAQRSLKLIDSELLPQAKASFEAARASFTSGSSDALRLLDALRAYLDVRVERIRALQRLLTAEADVERAFGGEIR